MKNKKIIIIIVLVLIAVLIIGGLLLLGNDKSSTDKIDKNDKVITANYSIMDGKYDDADLICKKEEKKVQTMTRYDVIYVFGKDKNVKKTNLVKLIVLSDKKLYEDQKKNDDKVFKRYYDDKALSISYEYEDEQKYITDDGFVHVEKTVTDYKNELEKDAYVCE